MFRIIKVVRSEAAAPSPASSLGHVLPSLPVLDEPPKDAGPEPVVETPSKLLTPIPLFVCGERGLPNSEFRPEGGPEEGGPEPGHEE